MRSRVIEFQCPISRVQAEAAATASGDEGIDFTGRALPMTASIKAVSMM